MLQGRVPITGGAGFLGRGIMRAAKRDMWPCQFVVYSRDQHKHHYAASKYPATKYVTGDILDTNRLHLVMMGCDYVVHAAALKHIPEGEQQPSEFIRVNVDGTRSVFDAARAAGVKRVVLISTDKAAAPVNAYGMTKALCERLVFESAELGGDGQTEYIGVRYGNVIGSTGSVWHAFKRQRDEYKQLLVTDPNMSRFFISVDDAVELVTTALMLGQPGTLLLGEPSSINMGVLADHLTDWWRLDPIRVTGRRPGEKSHEAMISDDEADRMAPCEGRAYWCMYGPTVALDTKHKNGGWTSETAYSLAPDEFVRIAEDSECV